MHLSSPSRRDFLSSTGALVGGAWLAQYLPAIRAAGAHAARSSARGTPAFELLTPPEAADLEAVAAQIFPTDGTPGAREAGVVYFIDRALGSFMASLADPVRGGVAELNAGIARERPGKRFADLDDAAQQAALRGVEQTLFFGLARMLTIMGMFANPEYGGNRDLDGWKLLGFSDAFAYQPPFGFYDRGHHGGGQ